MQKRVVLLVVVAMLVLALWLRSGGESPAVAQIRELAARVDPKTPEGVARQQAVKVVEALDAAGLKFKYQPWRGDIGFEFIEISAYQDEKRSPPYFVFRLPFEGPPSLTHRLHELEEIRDLGGVQVFSESVEVRSEEEIADGKPPSLSRLVQYVVVELTRTIRK